MRSNVLLGQAGGEPGIGDLHRGPGRGLSVAHGADQDVATTCTRHPTHPSKASIPSGQSHPQACKPPACIPGGSKVLGKRRNTIHSHDSPFRLGSSDLWDSRSTPIIPKAGRTEGRVTTRREPVRKPAPENTGDSSLDKRRENKEWPESSRKKNRVCVYL